MTEELFLQKEAEIKARGIADKKYDGEQIRLCEDGKYRWLYKLNMYTNPVVFMTVFKIFFWIIVIGFAVFGFFLYVIHGDWAGLWSMAKAMCIGLGGFFVLTLLGYLVVAIMYGGKYIVQFTMDKKEVSHTQVASQFKKARKLGAATAIGGLAAGRLSTAGAGMLAASHQSSTSSLEFVKKVKALRALNVIKVNQLLNKNQVYVPKEDFDFVFDFIRKNCPNAK